MRGQIDMDEYHGYASESDYHEHHTLLALIELETCEDNTLEMLSRIEDILSSRTYIEVRS